jgi:4-hydroxy-tetrahydrodipicolinate synthase
MPTFRDLYGVYAAAVTPLRSTLAPDTQGVISLMEFLHQRGCHGVLLMGTTGEGPSLSPSERRQLLKSAQTYRETNPDFRLLAGTGTPSLQETIDLTREAFRLGVDGVVVLPPYYFRKVDDDGLFAWFSYVIQKAVPDGRALFGYHFPGVSGVSLSLDLLARLKDAYPNRFAGLKDSSGDAEHARALVERFGSDLLVFTGSDRLLTHALQNHAAGCITALANLCSPLSRQIWDAFQKGQLLPEAQARLIEARHLVENYPPAAPLLKALLSRLHALPAWKVKPPLLPHDDKLMELAAGRFVTLLND